MAAAKKWVDARNYCKEKDMHLVTIDCSDKQKGFAKWLNRHSPPGMDGILESYSKFEQVLCEFELGGRASLMLVFIDSPESYIEANKYRFKALFAELLMQFF